MGTRGRPTLSAAIKKGKWLRVRLTEEEDSRLEQMRGDEKRSEFVRSMLAGEWDAHVERFGVDG